MSDHEEHSAAGHAHPPPGIPEVKDEAGDSPPWLPKLGVGLAVAVLLAFMLMRVLSPTPAADDGAAEHDGAPAADTE